MERSDPVSTKGMKDGASGSIVDAKSNEVASLSVSLLRDERSFISSISQFFNQEALSDVVIILDGSNAGSSEGSKELRFFSHKFILAKSSEVFRTMLYDEAWSSSSTEESVSLPSSPTLKPMPTASITTSPSGKRRHLRLKESPECCAVFSDFLRYLYTADISISVSTVVGILCLADKYDITSLKALTVKYMIENSKSPCVDNALNWYAWAKALNLPRLLEQCARTIAWNAQEVITSPFWLQMDIDFVHDILSSNELVINNEKVVFDGVRKWLLHDKEAKEMEGSATEHFVKNAEFLLPLVRLPQIYVNQLYEIESDDVMLANEKVRTQLSLLLSQAYRFRALCERQTELGVEFSKDNFYIPRDYLCLIVDKVRVQNNLRFGMQVDVKTFRGAAPCETKDADWKLTFRRQCDVWHIQLYCHESALKGGETRVQISVLIYDANDKVIQVHRDKPSVVTRGNSLNIELMMDQPEAAKQMAFLIKPVAA